MIGPLRSPIGLAHSAKGTLCSSVVRTSLLFHPFTAFVLHLHFYITLFNMVFVQMPGSSVGKALVSHTGVQGSIPTSDMKSFFNKYLQMQLLISLSRNLSCSNVEYSKSASVDCMHPLFSKNQSQLSCFKYKIMLCISQQSG